jgi:hypothetical protein
MHRSFLVAALLAGISGYAMSAGADQRLHDQGSRVEVQRRGDPGYDGRFVPPDQPAVGFGYYRPGQWWRRAATPWSYPPYAACAPGWCLPPYASYWGFLAAPGLLPLAAVLERLAAQEYSGFSSAVVEGANYNIIARNRNGQSVRLIVNAGNGQIRRILQ